MGEGKGAIVVVKAKDGGGVAMVRDGWIHAQLWNRGQEGLMD